MSPQLVHVIAKIAAVQARVEAMKAMNARREHNNMAQAYDEDQFFGAEQELETLAQAALGCAP